MALFVVIPVPPALATCQTSWLVPMKLYVSTAAPVVRVLVLH
ncbi:MAG: hypothetical protein ABI573_10665 [Chloroflexota bacterium]